GWMRGMETVFSRASGGCSGGSKEICRVLREVRKTVITIVSNVSKKAPKPLFLHVLIHSPSLRCDIWLARRGVQDQILCFQTLAPARALGVFNKSLYMDVRIG